MFGEMDIGMKVTIVVFVGLIITLGVVGVAWLRRR